MAAVVAAQPQKEILSFDRHLRHAFTPLSERLERGVQSIDTLINLLRERIQYDAEYCRSLDKLLENMDTDVYETGTIQEALEGIRSDLRNEYSARTDFVNALSDDVFKPLVQIRELYVQNNRRFAQTMKQNIKRLRSSQSKWAKSKDKFEKVSQDAEAARSALIVAKSGENVSTSQVLKLGSKVNSTMKTHQQWQEKYDQERLTWHREQTKFDEEMTSVLQGMQSNESVRLQTLGDCLRKWAVFITNLAANRSYDCKSLANLMSGVKPEDDLQDFMRATLKEHPVQIESSPLETSDSFTYPSVSQHHNGNNTTSSRRFSFSFSSKRKSTSLDASVQTLQEELQRNATELSKASPKKIQGNGPLTRLFGKRKKKHDRAESGPKMFNDSLLFDQSAEATSEGTTSYDDERKGQDRQHPIVTYKDNFSNSQATLDPEINTPSKERRELKYASRKYADANRAVMRSGSETHSLSKTNSSRTSQYVPKPRPAMPPPEPPAQLPRASSTALDRRTPAAHPALPRTGSTRSYRDRPNLLKKPRPKKGRVNTRIPRIPPPPTTEEKSGDQTPDIENRKIRRDDSVNSESYSRTPHPFHKGLGPKAMLVAKDVGNVSVSYISTTPTLSTARNDIEPPTVEESDGNDIEHSAPEVSESHTIEPESDSHSVLSDMD